MRTPVNCKCGYQISQDDVIQQGLVMVQFEPLYVYLKYRCANCGQIGEELVPCTEWNAELLQPGTHCPHCEGHCESEEEREEPAELDEMDDEIFAEQLLKLGQEDWAQLRRTL